MSDNSANALDVLARIEADYDAGFAKVEVPEWGVTFYSTPLTLAERDRIRTGHSENDDTGIMVSTVLEKALTKDRKPFFQSDAPTRALLMKKARAAILIRVLADMGGEDSVDDAKNA